MTDEEEMALARRLAENLATTRSPFSGAPKHVNVYKMFGELGWLFLVIYTTLDITLWQWDSINSCWLPMPGTYTGGD
jgi:hypothetical protein